MLVSKLARWAWILPAVLLALTLHQAYTAVQLRKTLDEGIVTWAEVTRYERTDRKDITNVVLDLIVHMPDGSEFTRLDLTLPYSIGHRVQADTLQVRVLRGAAQEVVIQEIGDTHVRIAWSNFGMSLIAFFMVFTGILAWNKVMQRKEES